MLFKSIIRMFEDGNVCVVGLRGRGKDMLMSNVVVRRGIPYVSNVCYDLHHHIEFNPSDFSCGGNSYKNFIDKSVNKYVYPFVDGTDLYLSDCGVYYPSQYCNELNRDYKHVSTYMALSRHLGQANVHTNCQNLNRIWDKLREQSDQYIACQWCKVFFGKLVLQKVIIYDNADSCQRRVKPYKPCLPLLYTREMKLQAELDKSRYEQTYGLVRGAWLLYINKSNYDTRVFKRILEEGN